MKSLKKYLSKSSLLVLICILSFSLCGCEMFKWKRYNNKVYRFSIFVPRGWQQVEDSRAVLLLVAPKDSPDDKFQETINVMVTEFPTVVPLTTFFELNREELMRVIPGAYNITESEVYAGRIPGLMLSLDGIVENLVLRMITASWMKDKRVYVVTCVTEPGKFSQYSPIFKKVFDSLRIY